MEALKMFARYEIGFLLAALTAVVAFQLLTGRINTRGLLSEKIKGGGLGGVSPARVQLLMFTVAAAVYVFSQVVNSMANGHPAQFPTIDQNLLLILFGSNSIYLGGKGLSLSGSQPKSKTKGD